MISIIIIIISSSSSSNIIVIIIIIIIISSSSSSSKSSMCITMVKYVITITIITGSGAGSRGARGKRPGETLQRRPGILTSSMIINLNKCTHI